ncbi:hypothetical protein PG996_003065 [Apiospora saccharicola]|uniref:DUF7735 domain-containing protein n=1 Tax=Apiospora saccharicola TaxID=335842 RepID=A0ABR1W346_9PEZI
MYPQSITSVGAVAVLAVLAVLAAAQSSSSAEAESSSNTRDTVMPEITPGPEELSRKCRTDIVTKVFIHREEPSGSLGDFVKSSSLYGSVNIPTSECDLLSKIPATLHEEYLTFQSERSEWWKSHRTDFTEWASTCTGSWATTHPNNGFADVVTPYQSHSAFLDTYDPASATTCAGVTRTAGAQETSSSEGAAPRQTMAAGAAALAAAAGAYAAAVAI